VIAPARATRPGAAPLLVADADDPAGCPFCEGREASTPPETFALGPPGRPADAPGWRVRVVPNKFPAFGPWAPEPARDGLFSRRTAVGRQEVVIHSPRHVRSLADLGARELEQVAEAWRARAAAAREEGFAYVHVLVNEGRAAGASLPHSHSQLLWLPEEPPQVIAERSSSGCVLCALVQAECEQRVRLVAERDGLVLLCAYAGRGPYEMLLAPRSCETDPFAGDLLGAALQLAAEGVRRLQAAEGAVPFNVWLHAGGHWHLELLPRVTVFAGVELGAGYFVNTMSPESAAGVLREA
jgi:UDPglucose--hexose-1-phosphate uridylyltransferase